MQRGCLGAQLNRNLILINLLASEKQRLESMSSDAWTTVSHRGKNNGKKSQLDSIAPSKKEIICENHPLNNIWILWFHSTNSNDWTINGYEQLLTIETVEDFWILINNVSDFSNGMYYLMRKGYPPLWDDAKNIHGGAWTFKVEKRQLNPFWEELSCYCLGETICEQSNNIVGLSISPKIRFATVRLWTSNTNQKADAFKHILTATQKNSVVIDFKQARFAANKDQAT